MDIAHIPEMLPLKSDFVFKRVFGDENNVDVLTAFLKSVLDLPDEEYAKVAIVDPHVYKESKADKAGVLDIKITTASGNIVHVEIQLEPEVPLRNRISYYQAKMITEQIDAGDDYNVIKKVVSIVITDFKLITDSADYHHTFGMNDLKHQIAFSDVQEIHTLELPKLPKAGDVTELFYWLLLIRTSKKEDYEMLAQKSPEFEKVVATVKRLSADEQTRAEYLTRKMWRMDYVGSLRNAEQNGLEQGRMEGRMEGETQRSFVIARNMKALGLSIDVIIQATGLDAGEIEKLN